MKVLVVIDMQKDFVNGSLGSEEAVSIVQNVVEKIDGFNGSIAVTHDTHKENYMDTQEGKHLPVPHCIDGEDGWQLYGSISLLCTALTEQMVGVWTTRSSMPSTKSLEMAIMLRFL